MISPKLTNCKECANIPDLLRKIDCKLAELGNNLYNNVVFMLNKPIANSEISQLLVYKRVLQHRFCDTHYAESCPTVSTEDIASKVIRLTAGCVPFCNEPTVCEITTCALNPCPNPTTTTTSTSSSSTTTTTTLAPTTTTTTTLNCNFSGSIDCSITTTTTTTPAPTTTTTTTYFPDPFGVPCLWSTNGGDPGLIGVYDFETNTATDVLVPNDFNETYGIERPICATEDKVWLASVVDIAPNSQSNDKVYIREWDIDATGVVPVLIYVREITVYMDTYQGYNLGGTSIWAMTAKDNDTLIVGTGNEYGAPAGTGGTGQFYGIKLDISTAGDFTIDDIPTENSESIGTTTSGTGKISNITYTNSGHFILSYRYDLKPDGAGQASKVGNWIRVFPTYPGDPNWVHGEVVIQPIKLQLNGYPEFTNNYTGVKDAPFWGVNGLAQVLHPETLEVYTIDQLPPYNLTLTTSVNSSNDWLSSATHCSNVEFEILDNPDCGLTYFPPFFFDAEGNPADPNFGGVYDPTPQEFQYFGMTCTATIANNVDALRWVAQSTDPYPVPIGCSGLVRPPSVGVPFTRIVQGNDFSITIEFPEPMNDVPIRASVLNSNEDGTSGDVYYVETNGGTPTLSINTGCFVQVNGNRLFGGVANPPFETAYNNEGDGEFKVTAPANYTSMTIYGNAPTGGNLFLGCPPPNCKNMVYIQQGATSCSDPESAGRCVSPPDVPVEQPTWTPILVWNKDTGVCTEVGPPPGTAFSSGDVSIGDNIVVTSSNFSLTPSTRDQCFVKYDCTVTDGVPSNLQWDEKRYVLPPFWDNFNNDTFIPNLEVINDNQIGVTVSKFSVGAPCWYDVRFLICTFPEIGEEMIVEEKFQFACASTNTGDIVVTYKPDGVTLNKLIALQGVEVAVEDGVLVNKLAVTQYDIATGALEVVTKAEDFIDPSGIGASLAIVDGELYAGSAVWAKIDWNYPYAWTLLANNEKPCPAGGAGTVPACRITDGFVPSPVSTTTTTTDPNTTTTTTTTVPGVRTIFTKFNLFNQSV